jgi:hypothetical protein
MDEGSELTTREGEHGMISIDVGFRFHHRPPRFPLVRASVLGMSVSALLPF